MSINIQIDKLVKVHDKSRYFKETKEAVENGDKYAIINLAASYANGKGTEENLEKAVYWYQRAAENGDKDAMYALVTCYCNGEGTEIMNIEKVFCWIQKVAENGNKDAMKFLAASAVPGAIVPPSAAANMQIMAPIVPKRIIGRRPRIW